jgi:5-dehydro-2-deoxygluconokinase
VSTEGVKVDGERLTALVVLGVLNDRSFPLIFYRENCADMRLTERTWTSVSSPAPRPWW